MQKVSFPFAHKLALAMVLLIVTGMLLLGGLIIHDQNKLLEKQMHAYANILIHQLSASVTDGFLTSNVLDIDVLVKNIAQYKEIQGIGFYTEEKKAHGQSGLIPAKLQFPDSKSHVVVMRWLPDEPSAKSDREREARPTFWQDFIAEQQPYLTYISTVSYQNVTIGYVLLTFDQSLLIQARNKTLYTIAITTIILIIFSIILAFYLGKRLSLPIKALVDASDAISKGDYKTRFDERRNDEFGILMRSLNIMAAGLLKKESVEKAFSRYLSPSVAQEILGNLESVNLGGQQVDASVLFVDIIGFTKLSQTMQPEKTNELLNDYFAYISQAAGIYGGHVDKYMGDCVMLVFGVPKEDEHHSFQAIACALLIEKIITTLNKQRSASKKIPVNFHIAANSGLMLAGNMGSKQRMEYTVIGDAVNLASRLAGCAKNNEVIISETMLERPGIKNAFNVDKKGEIKIRGHDEPVTIYRVKSCINKVQINLTRNMEKLINHELSEA
ncbi:adenylate/guanylate cyclase domain-containing protein [sulfur-oxidizing endosymbiont of Gigantopelta aegis]|uniref:adenylate/guanylate cyclase domain-containing protein n=1 Tax=sulfur-oxidizing endosymbiont of Gigantopelta aegis TaxID=2794934 RepID=UPI0018DB9B06|nr:adenylate/guanylate cyclase domain-containing protein [sulfur-oxidizing endosymbiont of Gigantopelta aegis]